MVLQPQRGQPGQKGAGGAGSCDPIPAASISALWQVGSCEARQVEKMDV